MDDYRDLLNRVGAEISDIISDDDYFATNTFTISREAFALLAEFVHMEQGIISLMHEKGHLITVSFARFTPDAFKMESEYPISHSTKNTVRKANARVKKSIDSRPDHPASIRKGKVLRTPQK